MNGLLGEDPLTAAPSGQIGTVMQSKIMGTAVECVTGFERDADPQSLQRLMRAKLELQRLARKYSPIL